ncbi:MAG: hypothetical protein K6B68_16075, partial [Eubacterium sp.]|nr:hypothetical protein [Eubacterium sp.]
MQVINGEVNKLEDIEEQLSNCVNIDKSNWIEISNLMELVEREKLYLQRPEIKSFTAWVNTFADEMHVHVSLLWSRKKAGNVIREYAQRLEENGKKFVGLENISVSPDSINLCEVIAGKNAVEMDKLIDKVIRGELKRSDLRAAAKAKKEKSDKDESATRHNRIEAKDRTENEENITAADIVIALRKSDWLPSKIEKQHFDNTYKSFTEFSVNTGTSRHRRRIDLLCAETFSTENTEDITLRGIEIKVNKNDLINDHKMAEY